MMLYLLDKQIHKSRYGSNYYRTGRPLSKCWSVCHTSSTPWYGSIYVSNWSRTRSRFESRE